MNQAESIMELLPLIGKIERQANFIVFKPREALTDIKVIRRKLELMGIREFPFQHESALEVSYVNAIPAQKKLLTAIITAQIRFDALKALHNNGGLQMSQAEQKYFKVKNAQQMTMNMAAQHTK